MRPVRIFIILLILGSLLIFLGVFLPRLSESVKHAPIWSAIIIFAISFISIILYTIIISVNKQMLTQDSADYAYYLGFSLTIVSLVMVFLSDGILQLVDIVNKSSDIKGGVRNILIQFGAGLSATMIGVVARIYLIDLLVQADVPTDESIRQIKTSLNDLIQEIRKQTLLYTATITECVGSLSNEILSINTNLRDLSKGIDDMGAVLVSSLKKAAESINNAYDISETENNMRGIAGKLKRMLKNITEASEILMSSVNNINSSLNNLQDSTDLSGRSMIALNTNMNSLNEKIISCSISADKIQKIVVDELNSFVKNIKNTSEALTLSTGATQDATSEMREYKIEIDKVNKSLSIFGNEANEGNQSMKILIDNIDDINERIEEIVKELRKMTSEIDVLADTGKKVSNSLGEVNREANSTEATLKRYNENIYAMNNNLAEMNQNIVRIVLGLKNMMSGI